MWPKLQLQLLLLSCVLSVCLSQIDQTCKEDGTYCQNHWECCSNSCFSYLYKCVKSYQTKPVFTTTIFLGPSIQLSSPLTGSHSSIESLLGSYFGTTPAPPFSLQEDTYLENRISEDEATTTTESETTDSDTTITSTTVEEPDCKAIGQKCYRNSECCTQRCHGFLHQCVT